MTRRSNLEIFLLILTGILSVCLFASLYRVYSIAPLGSIRGLYQTELVEGNFYNAQFFGDNQYYIEVDNGQRNKLTEGVFENIGDDNYLITDAASGQSTLITLRHNGFYYYYKPIDKVLYFTKRAP